MKPIDQIKQIMGDDSYSSGWEQLDAAKRVYDGLGTEREEVDTYLRTGEIDNSDRVLLIGYLHMRNRGSILTDYLDDGNVPKPTVYDALNEADLTEEEERLFISHLERAVREPANTERKLALYYLIVYGFEKALPHLQTEIDTSEPTNLAHVALALDELFEEDQTSFQTRLDQIAADSQIRRRKTEKLLKQFSMYE